MKLDSLSELEILQGSHNQLNRTIKQAALFHRKHLHFCIL